MQCGIQFSMQYSARIAKISQVYKHTGKVHTVRSMHTAEIDQGLVQCQSKYNPFIQRSHARIFPNATRLVGPVMLRVPLGQRAVTAPHSTSVSMVMAAE